MREREAQLQPGERRLERVRLIAVSAVIPVLFFTLAWMMPDRGFFEISTDEGINLIKALLVRGGYPLYSEVWSDQPPVFTHLLVFAFNLLGTDVENLRLVIALLSSLLLWVAFLYLHQVSGLNQAALGTILIILLPKYLVLSVSIMLGLPSIVFAVFSMAALTAWHRDHQRVYLFFSAVFLGVAVMIKLITGFLAPIFFTGLALSGLVNPDRGVGFWRKLSPAISWAVVFTGIVFLLTGYLVGVENIPQLAANHLGASNSEFFNASGEFRLSSHIGPSYPFIFLGLIAGISAVNRRKWVLMYPLAWMLSAHLLLALYSPVWYHHILLITVPAALLASEALSTGLGTLFRLARATVNRWRLSDIIYIAAVIGIGMVFTGPRSQDPVEYFTRSAADEAEAAGFDPDRERLLACIREFEDETSWLLTDRPMYAFRTNLLVPPEFAVLSLKRLRTGEVTEKDLIDGYLRYRPEQILLSRFEFPNLERRISTAYLLAVENPGERLYISHALLNGHDRPICEP